MVYVRATSNRPQRPNYLLKEKSRLPARLAFECTGRQPSLLNAPSALCLLRVEPVLRWQLNKTVAYISQRRQEAILILHEKNNFSPNVYLFTFTD